MQDGSKIGKFRTGTRSIIKNTGNVIRPILSNRCSYCLNNVLPIPTIDVSHTFGVDRLAVEIPLIPNVSDPKLLLSTIKNTQLGRWGTKATAIHPVTKSHIYFKINKARWSITMEFNPSRFMDPDGTTLVPVEAVGRVVELLIKEYFSDGEALPAFAVTEEGDESVERWEDDWRNQVRVTRLDVTRDLISTDPRFNVGLLSGRKAKYARGVSIIHNDQSPSTWDSPRSKQSSHVKLYDKYRQALRKGVKDLPAEGTFRFEYLMRKKHLQMAHIHTLEDLNRSKFEVALRQGWAISRLETPIAHPLGWQFQISESNLDPEQKLELIGYLQASSANIDIPMSKSKIRQIKTLARSIGISFRKPLNTQGNLFFHLNLEKGSIDASNSVEVYRDL